MAIAVEIALDAQSDLAESPIWDREESKLLWVDMARQQLHRFDPETERDYFIATPSRIGSVAVREKGGYIAALADGFWTVDFDNGQFEPLLRVPVVEGASLNDGKCDDQGRFWAGSVVIPEDVRPGDASSFPPAGVLYRLDQSHHLESMVTNVKVSNGLGWSPNGEIFYYIDSGTRCIERFDYESSSGALSNRQTFVKVDDDCTPDGMTVDSEGGLWVAIQFPDGRCGVVRRFGSSGALEDEVALPVPGITSCAFGGERLNTLFITSHNLRMEAPGAGAGGIFRCEPGVTGLPDFSYGG